ncbi:MAG: GSU2403 family nucleotidyltransferase fold protein [Alphaproteobacteria bacterium]|nr:GSU2403 family nucleotidyltransferase fold protein [Alphaproteobacteria bacterium]
MSRDPEFRRLPLTVQTTYADLLARLEEDAVLEVGGTPVLRQRDGHKYWYSVQRLADHTIEKYLGPDTEEVRARVERAREIREDLRERERERSRLARMCREAGLPAVDAQTGKVLLALSRAGLFRLRAVLVGTHAFRCYPGLLGVEISEAHAVTEDIDVAAFHSISVALDDQLDPDLEGVLGRIGPFIARPSLHQKPTAWRDNTAGTMVELLTPNQGKDTEEPVELPALGAHAVPLRFLDYLINEPVQAAALYRSGVLVNVPAPARYAIHKLIVAARRHSAAKTKAAKDIAQASVLIEILAADFPDELEAACEEACERGPAWREAIERGARRLPANARTALGDVTKLRSGTDRQT